MLGEASEVGRGLPRYVEQDLARYLEYGVLAHGFARVRCESCKDKLLVAFGIALGRTVMLVPGTGGVPNEVSSPRVEELVLPAPRPEARRRARVLPPTT